MDKLRKL